MPSIRKIVTESLKQEFPIPGQHNLKKVGKQIEIVEDDDLLLTSNTTMLATDAKKTVKQAFPEGYANRKEFEKAFNNHPFNRIFKFRNLMSGKKPITAGTLALNAIRDMAGWHEELAPEGQKVLNKAGIVLGKLVPTFALSLIKKILNLGLDIVKLPTVVLPSMLYKLSLKGMKSAVAQIKKVQKSIDKRNHTSVSLGEALLDGNLGALGGHLVDRAKQAGLGLLVGLAAVAFGVTRLWHFIGKATFAPRENFRSFWNARNEAGKRPVWAYALATLSILTTIAAYTTAAFFFAPIAMEGLTALSLATAGTPFGALVSGLVTGISTVANAIAVVTAPIGAALTAALEVIATFLPFLAPAAAAAGNMIPATLGLLTLGGTAVAVLGTGESIAQGALSDKYHSYALEKAIKEDTAGHTVAIMKGLSVAPATEKDPLLSKSPSPVATGTPPVIRSRSPSPSVKPANATLFAAPGSGAAASGAAVSPTASAHTSATNSRRSSSSI